MVKKRRAVDYPPDRRNKAELRVLLRGNKVELWVLPRGNKAEYGFCLKTTKNLYQPRSIIHAYRVYNNPYPARCNITDRARNMGHSSSLIIWNLLRHAVTCLTFRTNRHVDILIIPITKDGIKSVMWIRSWDGTYRSAGPFRFAKNVYKYSLGKSGVENPCRRFDFVIGHNRIICKLNEGIERATRAMVQP